MQYALPPLILKTVLVSLGHHGQAMQCTSSGKFFVELLVTVMDLRRQVSMQRDCSQVQNNAFHLYTKIGNVNEEQFELTCE